LHTDLVLKVCVINCLSGGFGTKIVRPDDGVWKIYNQTVEDVQY
jgi:hypothetical protein